MEQKKIISISVVAILIVAIGAVIFVLANDSDDGSDTKDGDGSEEVVEESSLNDEVDSTTPTVTSVNDEDMLAENMDESVDSSSPQGNDDTSNAYADGDYNVVGNYSTPGGVEDIGVNLTLANGIITNADVELLATDATSIRWQERFIDGYEEEVIGQNIDDVELDIVSGSSLTGRGFNDALEQIKLEARE